MRGPGEADGCAEGVALEAGVAELFAAGVALEEGVAELLVAGVGMRFWEVVEVGVSVSVLEPVSESVSVAMAA